MPFRIELTLSWSCSWGLAWGVLSEDLKANTYPDVPLSTLNLIAGSLNFTMAATSFVAGRLGDR